MSPQQPARVEDIERNAPPRPASMPVHELAWAMPHVTVDRGPKGNPIYQVDGHGSVLVRASRITELTR